MRFLGMLLLLATAGWAGDNVATLRTHLESGTPAERRDAADALAALGPKAKDAVPELTAALASNDAELLWRAAWALSRIGKDALPAAEPLIELLGNERDLIWWAAMHALEKIGPEFTPFLVPRLRTNHEHIDRYLTLLMRSEFQAEALPSLFHLFCNGTGLEQSGAQGVLWGAGPLAAPLAQKLVDLLAPTVNQSAMHDVLRILAAIGKASQAPLAEMAANKNYSPEVRGQVLGILARTGPGAAARIGKILDGSEERILYDYLFLAMSVHRVRDPNFVPVIEALMRKRGPENMHAVVRTLDAMGDKGQACLRRLLEPGELKPAFRGALLEQFDSETVPRNSKGPYASALIAALEDPHKDVREGALKALGTITLDTEGVRRTAALAARLLESGETFERERALRVLGRSGEAAARYVKVIREELGDWSAVVRLAAAAALLRLGFGGDEELALIREYEHADDRFTRIFSLRALHDAGAGAVPALDLLLKHVGADYAYAGTEPLVGVMPHLDEKSRRRVIEHVRSHGDDIALDFTRAAERARDARTLAQLLSHDAWPHHHAVIDALLSMRERAWPAVAPVEAAESPEAKKRAAEVLVRIDLVRAGPKRLELTLDTEFLRLRSNDPIDNSEKAVALIASMLEAKSRRVRTNAVMLLWRIGPPAHVALPGLWTLVRDAPEDKLRERALSAIHAILN